MNIVLTLRHKEHASGFFISIICPADLAMSVPEAIAIPTSAYISAGASFIPSPIMTTFYLN